MMKFRILLLTACLCWQLIQAQDLYISGGHYFDTNSGTMAANPGIVIRSGKIFSIGGTVPEGLKVIQLVENDYLLPGLFDLHAHYRVAFQGIEKDDTVAMPRLYLAAGVTSTFPAGEVEPYKMMDLRKRIDRGERPGPRIMNSGPYFGTSAPDWDTTFTIADINDRVDFWAEQGVSGFKAKNITAEHLEALIQRAHMHGLSVTGHLNSGYRTSVNPQEAIMMGIDRVEHFLGGRLLPDTTHAYMSLQSLDPQDPALQEIIDLYVEHGVYFDATIGTYGAIGMFEGPEWDDWIDETDFLTPFTREIVSRKQDPGPLYSLSQGIYPAKRGIIKRYFEAGGLITTGSDRPFLIGNPLGRILLGGFFIHREMEVMVNSGIPEAEVIKIATINGANAMGKGSVLGSIETGKWADLIIIKGNPLENIRNTRSVHSIIKGGMMYDRADLLEACKGKIGPQDANSWDTEIKK